MIDRIVRAVIEGRLLKSTLGKLLQKIYFVIDSVIGDLFLFLYMNNVPVNTHKVLFKTFQGEYVCNEKYICEKLLKYSDSLEIVWVHNSEQNGGISQYGFPENVKVVEDNSLAFYRELASAKVIVINSYLVLCRRIKLKKDQILLETWHGSLGIKKPIRNKAEDKVWLRAMRRTGKLTTYVLSNSRFESMVYADTFWKKTQIVQWGHARNDILFNKTAHQAIREKVLQAYRIPLSKKIILYAPTYRIPYSFERYQIDIEETIKAVQRRWGNEWIFAVRYHPSIRNLAKKEGKLFGTNVVDVTDYQDMQEILIAADIGISDYSSWMFDYLYLDKPCFIYAPDLKEYSVNRGLYYPIQKAPFPFGSDMETLIQNIQEYDESYDKDRRRRFLVQMGSIETGKACDITGKFILLQTGMKQE